MHEVQDDKVKDVRTGLGLILVQDGFDAAQCREEVSHKESREVEQGSKEEAEGHGSSSVQAATLRVRVPVTVPQKPMTTSHHRFDFQEHAISEAHNNLKLEELPS